MYIIVFCIGKSNGTKVICQVGSYKTVHDWVVVEC